MVGQLFGVIPKPINFVRAISVLQKFFFSQQGQRNIMISDFRIDVILYIRTAELTDMKGS